MNHNIAPDLTPVVIALAVIDLIAVLAVVGVVLSLTTAFFRSHRAVRVQRHEAFVPYYRHVALHH
jgi:maltodextrin utilization protein YvdJ